MLLTIKEAKEKWCPMARILSADGNASYNYRIGSGAASGCIGCDCMAWREVDEMKITKKGYCGLAGKPEAE